MVSSEELTGASAFLANAQVKLSVGTVYDSTFIGGCIPTRFIPYTIMMALHDLSANHSSIT